MDWTYATIPPLENIRVILHREKERKRHVENPKKDANEFVHYTNNFGKYAISSNFMVPIKENIKNEKVDEVWQMYFDGAYSKAGKGLVLAIGELTLGGLLGGVREFELVVGELG